MTILVALAFFALLFIIGLLWILVPALYGLPPVPTNPKRIRKALRLANLQAGRNHLRPRRRTRFIREYAGTRHVVTVQGGLFEYKDKTYKSLSAIASEIAGTRWNGWTFFGVKKPAPDRSGEVA